MGEVVILRPFFRYYGGKWRAVQAGLYPEPQHKRICEPFAGSAGYALHYPHLAIELVERDPVIARMWRWLVSASPDEVRSIPLVDSILDLPEWVSHGARDLIGFSMNAATSSPRVTLSASARKLREQGRRFYGWTEALRERVATQVPFIKHWRVNEGDYAQFVPHWTAEPTTYFVDPPYDTEAGSHYKYGREYVNYAHLGEWCRTRVGQVIACERSGADWLPFRDIGAIKSGPRTRSTREAVWP